MTTDEKETRETPDQKYRNAVRTIIGLWLSLVGLCILFAMLGTFEDGGGRSGALLFFAFTGPIWVPVLICCVNVRKKIEENTQPASAREDD